MASADAVELVSPPVHTYALSDVHGSANWILASGAARHRYCRPDTKLSLVEFETTDVDWESQVQLARTQCRLFEILCRRTNLPEVEAVFAVRHDRSFTAQEAIQAGIVDALANHEAGGQS